MNLIKPIKELNVVAILLLLAWACGGPEHPLSPGEALEAFEVPEGFRVELVAAEPDVIDPVAMAFDPQGRLFVVEMSDYPLDPKPRGRIKLLEDPDGDGLFDQSQVFADDLHMPSGVMPWKKGILVACAPDILYFEDTDADGRADIREVVLTGFAVTNPQLRVNGLLYGIDNWIYAAYPRVPTPVRYTEEFGDPGSPIQYPDHPEVKPLELHAQDLRFRPRQAKLEAVAGNSQYGNAFDVWGNRFTVWNNDHLRHVVVQQPYLRRNPYLVDPAAMNSISDHERACSLYQIATDPEYIHDSQVGHFTSASGISIDIGGVFPAAPHTRSFTCDPVHNVVHSDFVVPSGPTFIAQRAEQEREFLASKDSWFRPVFTTTGPDGALYVVDYHREVVEHPEFVPREMLEDVDFRPGEDRGRIYRVVHESAPKPTKPRLAAAGAEELVEKLAHPNMWWRITAQRLLVDRQDASVTPALEDMARQQDPFGRLHALWTLDGLQALRTALLLQALDDEEPGIREHAIRLAERRLADPPVRAKVVELLNDPEPKVELQAACSVGGLPGEKTFHLLEEVAQRHLEDRWFQTAVLASNPKFAGRWYRSFHRWKDFLDQSSEGKERFVRSVASVLGARRQDAEIAMALEPVRNTHSPKATWWRQATLEGVSEGLDHAGEAQEHLPATQRALMALLASPSPEVRDSSLQIAHKIKLTHSPELRAALQRASSSAGNEEAAIEDRVFAARALGLDASGDTVPLLAKFLKPQVSERLQIAAVEALSHRQTPETIHALLEGWKAYTGPVREAVLQALYGSRAGVEAVLDALESGEVQLWSLSRGRRRQLLRYPDEKIRQRADVLFGEQVQSDRAAVYEEYRPALRLDGDTARGREVFDRVCAECHKVGDTGWEVGPDLLGVVSRNREVLMTDILMPNEAIESGYVEYLLETKDGRTLTGIIAAETADTVTLRRAKGEEDTVPREQIADLRSLNVSAMPEDLEQDISQQGMADLLAYLKSL